MSDVWTDAQVSRLKELWPKGYSASQIAADLGAGITRSAVIGKIHRLNLGGKGGARTISGSRPAASQPEFEPPRAESRFNPPADRAAALKKRPRPKPMQPRSNTIGDRIALAPDEPGLPDRLQEPAVGSGIQLIQLTNCTCRWPFGDPLSERFYFCGTAGADLKAGRPYCEFHTHKAAGERVNQRRFDGSALFAAGSRPTSTKGANHGKGY